MAEHPILSLIVFLLILLAVVTYLPTKKEQLETGRWVDFTDDYKDMMSKLTQSALQYADPMGGRHLIYRHLDRNAIVNSKRIDGETVSIKFMLKAFGDGRQEIHAYTQCHYGKPEFSGGEVFQNYNITEHQFEANAYEFEKLWKQILEFHFSVKLDGITDKIKLV